VPLYAYRYLGPDGPKTGYMEAENEDALLRALQEQGILPLEVSRVRERGARKLPPKLLASSFRAWSWRPSESPTEQGKTTRRWSASPSTTLG
jgi:type II secretory pathway component PulF